MKKWLNGFSTNVHWLIVKATLLCAGFIGIGELYNKHWMAALCATVYWLILFCFDSWYFDNVTCPQDLASIKWRGMVEERISEISNLLWRLNDDGCKHVSDKERPRYLACIEKHRANLMTMWQSDKNTMRIVALLASFWAALNEFYAGGLGRALLWSLFAVAISFFNDWHARRIIFAAESQAFEEINPELEKRASELSDLYDAKDSYLYDA